MAFLLFGGKTAFADCPVPGTPTKELKRATAVFSGKVIDTERRKITDASSEDFGGEQLFVKLKVARWWKGGGDSDIVLRTSTVYFPDTTKEYGEGFRFSDGETYLVYAFYFNGAYGTSGCTRTAKLSEAGEDLKELGEGFPPSLKRKINEFRFLQ